MKYMDTYIAHRLLMVKYKNVFYHLFVARQTAKYMYWFQCHKCKLLSEHPFQAPYLIAICYHDLNPIALKGFYYKHM